MRSQRDAADTEIAKLQERLARLEGRAGQDTPSATQEESLPGHLDNYDPNNPHATKRKISKFSIFLL